MRKSLQTALLAAFVLAGFGITSTFAAETHKPAAAQDAANSNGFHLAPFQADAQVSQSTTVDGKTLKYTVTVGSLPVRDEKGEITGEVVFTAYRMSGRIGR